MPTVQILLNLTDGNPLGFCSVGIGDDQCFLAVADYEWFDVFGKHNVDCRLARRTTAGEILCADSTINLIWYEKDKLSQECLLKIYEALKAMPASWDPAIA